MDGKKKRQKISVISTIHYFRLVYRSALFVMLLVEYILYRVGVQEFPEPGIGKQTAVSLLIWIVFAVEMIFRFFPSKYESPGCQKQFKRNYIKSGRTDIKIADNNATILVALIWVVFNAIFGALYMLDIFDKGIMFLLCVA